MRILDWQKSDLLENEHHDRIVLNFLDACKQLPYDILVYYLHSQCYMEVNHAKKSIQRLISDNKIKFAVYGLSSQAVVELCRHG